MLFFSFFMLSATWCRYRYDAVCKIQIVVQYIAYYVSENVMDPYAPRIINYLDRIAFTIPGFQNRFDWYNLLFVLANIVIELRRIQFSGPSNLFNFIGYVVLKMFFYIYIYYYYLTNFDCIAAHTGTICFLFIPVI